ncbi:hypothetical protein GGTG_13201 [Gaeumannomyces tritici R3-111a-1]|uniref:FAM86A protein n=1 Tax=Gaeumannomyces tritici (strain R3-111a-1) TaxID=644352 RepID=J3PI73_GAET3|nr:hypothetical protein GGTG_13201 [Gaeumannomyces tritici R3-111a-1]EJT69585.1 hypothetical protein GGTG_13201 [Gaeumannomyces tritici R3-111a-1]
MERFCWQYLQLESSLDFPAPEALREEACQEELFRRLFADGALAHPPPHRYQLAVLKELSEATAAQQKSYVTYHLSLLEPAPAATEKGYTTAAATPTIALLEARSLISALGTTGLRTWEAALHLGQYLCASDSGRLADGGTVVRGRRVLELGAGTGYLSVLCAAHLGAARVVASDGSDDVVNALPDSLFINGLQHDPSSSSSPARVAPMDLKWGHALVGTEDAAWDGGRGVDIVIGADITYDKGLVGALMGTLVELAGMFPGVEIVIAATERNRETYQAFLDAAGRSAELQVVGHVDFQVDGSRGPFFDSAVPIHISCFKVCQTSSILGPNVKLAPPILIVQATGKLSALAIAV